MSTAVVVATFPFFRGTQHTHLFIPDRKTTTDKSTNTTAVQFGDPKSFIGVAYLGEGSHYSTNDCKTTTSPEPKCVCRSQSWEPGAHCTASGQLNMLKSVLSTCLSWSKHPTAPCFCQAAGLVRNFIWSSASFPLR